MVYQPNSPGTSFERSRPSVGAVAMALFEWRAAGGTSLEEREGILSSFFRGNNTNKKQAAIDLAREIKEQK